MSVLSLEDLSYSIAGRPLLDHASLMVDAGRRIGLIGRNGAGKSTLLKLIAGGLRPDGGAIRLGNRVKLGYVAQEAPGGSGVGVGEAPLAQGVGGLRGGLGVHGIGSGLRSLLHYLSRAGPNTQGGRPKR